MSVQCNARPLGGGRCELNQGHEGKHRKQLFQYKYPDPTPIPNGWFEWTEESQQRMADKHGSRFD